MKNNQNSKKKISTLMFSDISPEKKQNVLYYQEPIVRNENIYVPYGANNSFPNDLIQAIKCSTSAQSILSGTMEIVKNFDIKQNFTLPYAPYLNSYHDTLPELVSNLVYDQMVFGSFYIQVIYNKLGELSQIVHIPAEMIRLNLNRDKIFFNRFWSKYSTNAIEYNVLNKNTREDNEYSQIYVYTNGGHRQTYGNSAFNACLNDIVSEARCSEYIKNTLDSGLASRFIIDLPNSANLDDKQKEDIEQAINDKFCGAENAGAFMLYFNNSDEELKISTVDSDSSHERFESIARYTKEQIFTCLHTTPNLFGSPTQTTGFNSQEYQDAYDLFFKMTISPLLGNIIEALNIIFDSDRAIEIITDSKKQDELINESQETVEHNKEIEEKSQTTL